MEEGGDNKEEDGGGQEEAIGARNPTCQLIN
jgi:hypothetical protein